VTQRIPYGNGGKPCPISTHSSARLFKKGSVWYGFARAVSPRIPMDMEKGPLSYRFDKISGNTAGKEDK